MIIPLFSRKVKIFIKIPRWYCHIRLIIILAVESYKIDDPPLETCKCSIIAVKSV